MNWRFIQSTVKIQTLLENTNELERFSIVSSVTHQPSSVMDIFGLGADAILCTVCFQATDMAGYTCLRTLIGGDKAGPATF